MGRLWSLCHKSMDAGSIDGGLVWASSFPVRLLSRPAYDDDTEQQGRCRTSESAGGIFGRESRLRTPCRRFIKRSSHR